MIKEHEKEGEKKPKRKYLKKEKANKKENTKVKKDKKCTTKFYNSLPKYMIYIKSRFSTRITRWRSTKLTGLSRNPYTGGRKNNNKV